MEKFDLILKELQMLNRRVNELDSNMVTKQDLEQLSKKLDAIASQVAYNTEQEVILKDVSQKIIDHEMDIRLIKRMITNK